MKIHTVVLKILGGCLLLLRCLIAAVCTSTSCCRIVICDLHSYIISYEVFCIFTYPPVPYWPYGPACRIHLSFIIYYSLQSTLIICDLEAPTYRRNIKSLICVEFMVHCSYVIFVDLLFFLLHCSCCALFIRNCHWFFAGLIGWVPLDDLGKISGHCDTMINPNMFVINKRFWT